MSISSRYEVRCICIAAVMIVSLAAGVKQPTEVQRSGVVVAPYSSQVRQVITLPSGYHLNLIRVGPVYSTTTHKVLGVMLAYQTKIPVNDVASLAREADGIFKFFRVNAERGGYSAAILSATEPDRGSGLVQNAGFRFVYERDKSRKWKRDFSK